MRQQFALFLAALAITMAGQARAADSYCVQCHEEEAKLEKGAVHSKENVTCVDCHGGDPTEEDKEAAKAPGTGYKGKIPKTGVPELCGDCHSDVRKMNPYGLPTDQLDQYRYSHHGEALMQDGDTSVAACADCHGAHGILPPDKPESRVFPKNIAATCGECHADGDRMSAHGLDADQVELYKQSIHAKMLYEEGDLSAPTCVTCHGNHSAVPPGFRDVGLVCGKCHVNQKEYFHQGPHAEPAAEGDFDECVTCHRNHKVEEASLRLFGTCKLCHDRDSEGFARARDTYTLLKETREEYETTEETLEDAARSGFETEDEQVLMADARTWLLRLEPMQHALDMEELKETAGKVDDLTGEVKQRIKDKKQEIKTRKFAMIPVSAFLVFMSVFFWLKSRQLDKK